jgi:hypothetical protein
LPLSAEAGYPGALYKDILMATMMWAAARLDDETVNSAGLLFLARPGFRIIMMKNGGFRRLDPVSRRAF